MATKLNPPKFDCYARALPEEEMFTFLGRDDCSPDVIDYWCSLRINRGENLPNDEQIVEARQCATNMRMQYAAIRAKLA